LHFAADTAFFAAKTSRTGELDGLVGQGHGDREKMAYLVSYVARTITQPRLVTTNTPAHLIVAILLARAIPHSNFSANQLFLFR
jgi:hypothetical protein